MKRKKLFPLLITLLISGCTQGGSKTDNNVVRVALQALAAVMGVRVGGCPPPLSCARASFPDPNPPPSVHRQHL